MGESYVQVPFSVMARAEVAPSTRLVYQALLSFAWDDPDCYPSEGQLSSRAGVGVRTVRRALLELQAPALGWVGVDAAAGRRHRYRILGPRSDPEPPRSRVRTPAKVAGVNGAKPASLAGVPASLAGVRGHVDRGTPAILAADVDPKNKTQRPDPPTREKAVANTESGAPTVAERIRQKRLDQAAWRASREPTGS